MFEETDKPKSKRGGARPGAGRKKGMIQKLSGSELLKQIQRTTGKRFEQLLAEHYRDSFLRADWQAVRDYEKTILSKVIADKVDVTTNGESMNANFIFPQRELNDWTNIPVTITTDAKD
jgi:hypothetical protein